MATMSSIRTQISQIVRNRTWTDPKILALANRGVEAIAAGITAVYPDGSRILTPPLPDLATSGTVTTSTTNPYANLPTNYQRHLYTVVSYTNSTPVQIIPTHDEFTTYYPNLDLTCQVIACSVRGSVLWYQGMPSSAETLTVYYYRKPTAITEGTITSAPDGLPPHLSEELVINYCCMKIWAEIESGVGAQKVNTREYEARFNNALIDLISFVPVNAEPVIFGADYSE